MNRYKGYKLLFIPLSLIVLIAASCERESQNNRGSEWNLAERVLFEREDPMAEPPTSSVAHSEANNSGPAQSSLVDIAIGDAVFTAVFYNNETAQALIGQMPLTIDMADLNHNEKYYHLPKNLPGDATEKPATIYGGEIMCWSSNSLVLFYDTFPNSYGGYIRIGYIEDITGLAEAVGDGNIAVTFSYSSTN